ncbi:ComA operon protein 2 [Actinokineospora spheciospongiae]|uniref:ComA operon protein 2 n=1 Tax=Actinokineospora spheciospongiae TaxID=909613 RepID=W7J1B7_9PSEU|nr:hotdog fold thioesterase [Actinokineospora spheciospongiae]EWC59909.1 ComA operon protein 2 [Actinokineospora spheciospongiae]
MSGSADPTKLPGVLPEVADQLLADKLGIDITDWTPDRLVATMPVKGNLQPYGLLHGGANAVLAETVGSIAAALNAPEGKVVVGLELSCTHHRAARAGVVTAVCTPLHLGRSTSTFEIAITEESGKRTCTARLTCVAVDRAPGAK